MSKGDRDTLHGRSNLDIVRLTLENISKNLEEEAARYELTEKENEKLRSECSAVKLERDAANKSLLVN